MGNLVQLVTARRLQLAGHHPLILVGGATGLIGDPKDAGERVLNSKEVVAGWVERIRAPGRAAGRPRRRQPGHAWSTTWTGPRRCRRWTSCATSASTSRSTGCSAGTWSGARLEAGISYTEFSYVLLQAMDYLELFRRHGCRLQTGGSDQWGNITAGVELIRRVEGEQVHALATPLVTKADGTKYGKTETGTLWLDPELMSPYAFHQFWLHAEDSMVGSYLRIFSFRPLDEIERLLAEHEAAARGPAGPARPGRRRDRAGSRRATSCATPRRPGRRCSVAATWRPCPSRRWWPPLAEAPHARVESGDTLPSVVDALVATGLAASRSQARRTVEDGGAYVNNERVTAADDPLPADALLHGRFLVVRKGKRSVGWRWSRLVPGEPRRPRASAGAPAPASGFDSLPSALPRVSPVAASDGAQGLWPGARLRRNPGSISRVHRLRPDRVVAGARAGRSRFDRLRPDR